MGLTNESIGWLLLGCLIGYIVRYLQDLAEDMRQVKKEVHEVDDVITNRTTPDLYEPRQEQETKKKFAFRNIALLVVVVITVFAAFQSQKASNDIKDTQSRLAAVTSCNQQYLTKTIAALGQRTTYTQAQTEANVSLQTAQADFIRLVLVVPPRPDTERRQALQTYFDALTHFIDVSNKSVDKVAQNPYPTIEELSSCLEQKE